jgi:hypothetical protein
VVRSSLTSCPVYPLDLQTSRLILTGPIKSWNVYSLWVGIRSNLRNTALEMGHALQMIILALIWKLIDQCVVVNDTQRTRLPFRLCAINPLFRTYRLPSLKWHHPALEHRNGYEVFRLGLILLWSDLPPYSGCSTLLCQ